MCLPIITIRWLQRCNPRESAKLRVASHMQNRKATSTYARSLLIGQNVFNLRFSELLDIGFFKAESHDRIDHIQSRYFFGQTVNGGGTVH